MGGREGVATITIGDALQQAQHRLRNTPFEAAPREARLLLGHVLGLDEVRLLTRDRRPLAAGEVDRFEALLTRRLDGEPVAYLLGEREFYGRPFAVDRRVLIPRPETEHLVEAALELLDTSGGAAPRVLDIGTGSGCIAVTLAAERPGLRALATDRSPGAAAVAVANARRLGVAARVTIAVADLDGGWPWGPFDLVVSNPPYIDPDDAPTLSPEVADFEPDAALFAADGGLAMLHRLLDRASARDACPLVVEIGYGQLPALASAASARGLETSKVVHDYAGIPRTVILRRAVASRSPSIAPFSSPH